MNKLKIYAILFLTLTVFACNKTQDQATGVGDALVVSKKIGTQTVYGISLYAYTFSSFKSVTAVNSIVADHIYTLSANQGYATNFHYETPDSEFTTTKPVASTYNFSAVFNNGTTGEFQDYLTDQVLDLPNITKCEYSTTDHQFEMNWDLLTNADSYAINILDGTTVVFASPELAKTIKAYAISVSGGGWATGFTPVVGKTYTIRLLAFMYEPGGDAYNVQAASLTDKTAAWGN